MLEWLAGLGLCLSLFAGAATRGSAPVDRQELRFDTPHELASQRESQRRFRWREKQPDFRLADETFRVYIPPKPDPAEGARLGLLVWVSPTPRGDVPPEWTDALDRRQIAWIGADRSGNDRPIDHRVRLAVEAALQMSERYAIDPQRVYVGGFSGGGKVAAMGAVVYSDVFRGTLSVCGTTFYRHIPTGLKKDEFYPQGYFAPPAPRMRAAREAGRHVLLTGDADFNLQPTRQTFQLGYVKDGFRHVTLTVVPGLDHALPDAAAFAAALDALDRAVAPATAPARRPPAR